MVVAEGAALIAETGEQTDGSSRGAALIGKTGNQNRW
jgi:hypothetical protein